MFSLEKGGGSSLQGRSLVSAGTNEAPGSDGYGVGGECVEFCLTGETGKRAEQGTLRSCLERFL
jgi:hypothetical protein